MKFELIFTVHTSLSSNLNFVSGSKYIGLLLIDQLTNEKVSVDFFYFDGRALTANFINQKPE